MSVTQGIGAGTGDAKARSAGQVTSWERVYAAGVLRGLTLACEAPITILIDVSAEESTVGAGAVALRLLAGIGRPRSGRVRALGGDPARSAALRRSIALLGDDVLLDHAGSLQDATAVIASVREVPALATQDGVFAALARLGAASPSREIARRRLADEIAAADRARLVLVSHPERYTQPEARDALFATVWRAVGRRVPVVIATSAVDEVLSLVADPSAIAAVLVSGAVAVAGPAHGLPWALPIDGVAARVVRVVLGDDAQPKAPASAAHLDAGDVGDAGDAGDAGDVGDAREARDAGDAGVTHTPASSHRLAPSARLAADLLGDVGVAHLVVSAEPCGPYELRIQTRDARAMGRAIAARARGGLAVRQFAIEGAPAGAVPLLYGAVSR